MLTTVAGLFSARGPFFVVDKKGADIISALSRCMRVGRWPLLRAILQATLGTARRLRTDWQQCVPPILGGGGRFLGPVVIFRAQ